MVNLREELLKRRKDLAPQKRRSKLTSDELESLAKKIGQTQVQRYPVGIKKKKKIPAKKGKKASDRSEEDAVGLEEPDEMRYAQLKGKKTNKKKANRDIITKMAKVYPNTPQEIQEKQLLHGTRKKKRPLSSDEIEDLLVPGRKKKAKKSKSKAKKKRTGSGQEDNSGFGDSGGFGGEMEEDVRYTRMNPIRLDYKQVYPEYSEHQHQGEGWTYATDPSHTGNYNPRGSLNPPLNYSELNYTANFPLGPHRNSNVPWQEYPNIFGQPNAISGGNQEGPYFPGGAKNHYYQIDDVPVNNYEPLVARTASLMDPYQLNNVSQEHLLTYPRTNNSGKQGQRQDRFQQSYRNWE